MILDQLALLHVGCQESKEFAENAQALKQEENAS
jgi:hypothetical protein